MKGEPQLYDRLNCIGFLANSGFVVNNLWFLFDYDWYNFSQWNLTKRYLDGLFNQSPCKVVEFQRTTIRYSIDTDYCNVLIFHGLNHLDFFVYFSFLYCNYVAHTGGAPLMNDEMGCVLALHTPGNKRLIELADF